MTTIVGSYKGQRIHELVLPPPTGDREIDAMVMSLSVATVRSKVSRFIRRSGFYPSDGLIQIDVIDDGNPHALDRVDR